MVMHYDSRTLSAWFSVALRVTGAGRRNNRNGARKPGCLEGLKTTHCCLSRTSAGATTVEFAGDYCGVLKIGLCKETGVLKFYSRKNDVQLEWRKLHWGRLSRIGSVFAKGGPKATFNSSIEKSVRIIKELNKLT